MDQGYVKLWRKTVDNGWLSNHKLWAFWCYCLMRANYKPRKANVGFTFIELDPGQFIFGRRQASKDIKLSERTVRTCLQALISTNNITIKTTNRFSIITIVNWAAYQDDEKITTHRTTSKTTNDRPTGDPRVTTDKKVRIKERESIVVPEWIPEKIWSEFKEFRIRKKAPLTDRAVKKTIEELSRLRELGNDPEKVLEQSIYRGWTGVFKLKLEERNVKQSGFPERRDTGSRSGREQRTLEIFARRELERQQREGGGPKPAD